MKRFDYFAPRTLAEAVDFLHQVKGALPLAGGTDLLVQAKERNRPIQALVGLGRIAELGVLSRNGGLSLGSTVTAGKVAGDARVRADYAALAMGARLIGSVQIRNMATVGGNVCNASPSADTAPGLLVLGARVVLHGPQGQRELPLEEFFQGPGKTALEPGEVLVRFEMPAPATRSGSYYLRHTPRAWMDLSFAGAAVWVSLGERGEIAAVRIALGAVAPTPLRAQAAEERLRGNLPEERLLEEAARIAASEARPIDDLRASAEYRQHLTEVLVRRALQGALVNARAVSAAD